MTRTSENQIANLLEEESYSERETDSDDDVDNLIINFGFGMRPERICICEKLKSIVSDFFFTNPSALFGH